MAKNLFGFYYQQGMKNENHDNQKLANTFKVGRETYTIGINGNVFSHSFGALGHMEDIIKTAKWFSDIFDLMDEIEDGLTEPSQDLS